MVIGTMAADAEENDLSGKGGKLGTEACLFDGGENQERV